MVKSLQEDMRHMKMKTKKNILIAGGTGFIGKHFVELAKNEYNCYVLTRQNLENKDNVFYITCDLNNLTQEIVGSLLAEYKFDSIVYMAANIPLMGQKKENYVDALHSTLEPFVRFAQYTHKLCKKFIYISSIDVVGIPKTSEYDEKTELNPFTPYAVAKLAGEEYIKSIALVNTLDLTILRFSQVFGENEPIVRIIPLLLDCIKNNKPFNLYGTGEEKRKFLYVQDAAKAILCALKSNKTGIYNIAGKSVDSINDLIEITQKVFGKKLEINHVEYNGNTFDNIPSNESAKEIGYEPTYNLEDSIRKIYNALRN